jgi:hypothetical protein
MPCARHLSTIDLHMPITSDVIPSETTLPDGASGDPDIGGA